MKKNQTRPRNLRSTWRHTTADRRLWAVLDLGEQP